MNVPVTVNSPSMATLNKNYRFTALERGKWGYSTYEGIRVAKNAGTITESILTRLGNPEYVNLSVDLEMQSILIRKTNANDPGAYKIGNQHKGQTHSIATGAIARAGLPLGRYYYVEDFENGVVLSNTKREL